jgi:glycosyltransferase 2 family protein
MQEHPAISSIAREKRRGFQNSWLLPVALAGVLLFLAFRGVAWGAMLETIRQARLPLLGAAFAVLTGSYFLRGLRWRVLLSAERAVTSGVTFWATVVGYLGNSFLPARAGEFIRSAMVGRHTGLSMIYVLATALTERLVDVLALVLIGAVGLMAQAELPGWLRTAVQAMAVFGLIGVAGLCLAPHLGRPLQYLVSRLPLSAKLSGRVASGLDEFLLGMRALAHPGRAVTFVGYTTIIWLLDAVVAMLVAQSLDLPLTLPVALLLLAALGLASAAPSTPGYVGIYQFVAVSVLGSFGMVRFQSLAYILTFQAVTYLVVIVWGLIGMWRLSVPREAPVE